VLLLCSRTLIVVDYCLLVVLLVSSTWVVASKGVHCIGHTGVFFVYNLTTPDRINRSVPSWWHSWV